MLRVVETGVTLCLTQEEAHELFERVLNSNAEDTPASAQALKKLANAIGTSFAAPQVSAAAALILGQDPSLSPDQVTWLLERAAQVAQA